MENPNSKIKIFISMHKDFYVPDNRLLQPIQVGAGIAEKRYDNMLHDDEGDNISDRNKRYCELTAQYWVWKNMPDLDYYGFFHYRRYLSFNPVALPHYENIVHFDYCDDKAVSDIMLDEQTMTNLITKYDVIYPMENPLRGNSVADHWKQNLVQEDLDLMVKIIMEKYPEFYDATREVLNSKESLHCNMFIMKKEIFNAYNEWLFDILFEHEKRCDHSNYCTEKYRTMGHLGERLCAIYGKYLEKHGANICYVQRTLFRNTEKLDVVEDANEPNAVPIVLSCSNYYVRFASVLIESIKQNASADFRYKIYILNNDITAENQQLLTDQINSYGNFSIRFVDVRRRMAEYANISADRYLSIQTFFRLCITDIFPNMDKIVYLDGDTIVCHDISELYNTDLLGKSIGACRDADIISLYPNECNRDPEVRDSINNHLCLSNFTDYFQAGVLILNLRKIRSRYTTKQLFDIALSRKWKFLDQDVLNFAFKDDVHYLDMSWNTLYECFERMERVKNFAPKDIHADYVRAKSAPKIIHYAGVPKPWDNIYVDMAGVFWKYAANAPVFEMLVHDLNNAEFRAMKDAMFPSANEAPATGSFAPSPEEIQRWNSTNEELHRAKTDLEYMRNSVSFRVGRIITFIPRKVRDLFRKK